MTEEMKADQDWKEQAQAEKERLSREIDGAGEGRADSLPPASFDSLLRQLAMQAAMCLGEIPDPTSGNSDVNLGLARYHIDMLGVLQEKTQGNLSPEEESAIKGLLTDLRMRFVSASSGGPQQQPGAQDRPGGGSRIITP
jgi:hypothetical protein